MLWILSSKLEMDFYDVTCKKIKTLKLTSVWKVWLGKDPFERVNEK